MSQGSPAATGSGSGTAEPAHGQHGHSSPDDDAAAAASSPPTLPPAAPLQRPQEKRDGEQAGASSSAAAGVDRKGKNLPSAPAVPSSESSSSSSGGSSPEDADAAASGARPFDSTAVFQQLLREQTAIKEAGGPLAEGAGKKKKPEEAQVKSSHAIAELWHNLIKFFHGEEWHYSEHVNYQTHPITEVRKYYRVPNLATGQGVDHLDAYSEFRRVTGDGECFYRSFIFSYLEQVLDRQDKHEEHRLLDAVKRVSVQHADLGWTSKFPRSYRAFKKLIRKLKRWKRHGMWKWNSITSTSSYRKEKLLEFFRSYDTTQDILTFLRLVVAIWICSHAEEYEQRVPDLSEHYSLKDWCFEHVTPSREYTDHVMMTALAEALEVPLKVEQLNGGPAHDIYTAPGPGVPLVSVTLLYTGIHYDVLYPRAAPAESSS
ncbi:OVARIAN TUMOR DOMAIN-containing deubiquitinating enzyme 1-like [Triticum dicoccoides]|uniref:OVARIAN TUMOR DOMAIN-containing deubiquitinating enzyme 1-like n=1 Tax=Triticum dicoccoides TaxID=85692 RepID=UPI0018901F0B|nr:OVARIAN TUMOR DOMAIN-containing deubiquitinating enzyme 1-like [Triticum dicoccoides]